MCELGEHFLKVFLIIGLYIASVFHYFNLYFESVFLARNVQIMYWIPLFVFKVLFINLRESVQAGVGQSVQEVCKQGWGRERFLSRLYADSLGSPNKTENLIKS